MAAQAVSDGDKVFVMFACIGVGLLFMLAGWGLSRFKRLETVAWALALVGMIAVVVAPWMVS